MPNYRIVLTVPGTRIDAVRKAVQSAFGQDIGYQIAKIETQPTREERLSEAEGWVADAKNVVDEIHGEMQTWMENMPDSLRSGPKAEEIEECIGQLEDIQSNLEQVEFSDVSFPKMM